MNKKILFIFITFFVFALFLSRNKVSANLIYLELTWPALNDQAIPGPLVEGNTEEEVFETTVIDTSTFALPKFDTGIKLVMAELVWPPVDADGFLGPFVEDDKSETIEIENIESDFKIISIKKIDSEKSKIVIQCAKNPERITGLNLNMNEKQIAGKKDTNYDFKLENEIYYINFFFANSYLIFGDNKIAADITTAKNSFKYFFNAEGHFGVKPDLAVDFPEGLYANSPGNIKVILKKIQEQPNNINIYSKDLYEFELTDNGNGLKKINYTIDKGDFEEISVFTFSIGKHTINLMFQNNPAVTTQFELIEKVEEIPEFKISCVADYMNFSNGEYVIKGTVEIDITNYSESLRQKITTVKIDENYSVSGKVSDKINLTNVEFSIIESEGFQRVDLLDAENKTIRFEYLRLTDIKYTPPKPEVLEIKSTFQTSDISYSNGDYIATGNLEVDISKFSANSKQRIAFVRVDENLSVNNKSTDKLVFSNIKFLITQNEISGSKDNKEGAQYVEVIDNDNNVLCYDQIKLKLPPEPVIRLVVEINNLLIFGMTVDELKQKTKMNRSDIEKAGLIDFTYETNKTNVKIEISFDYGSIWQNIENATVKFNPDNKKFSLQVRFIAEDGDMVAYTLYDYEKPEIDNKTDREMIKDLLNKYAEAIRYENKDNAHSCFSSSYQGTKRYKDYNTVKSLLDDAFSSEETITCEWQNDSINPSGDNAEVEADFIRRLRVTGNPSQIYDKNKGIKLTLKKENGDWYFWQDKDEKIIGYNGSLPPDKPERKRTK